MPLTSTSPTYLHVAQNASLIILSIICFPLLTTIAVFSNFIAPYLQVTKHIQNYRKWRHISSSTFRPRTILVTGVGMSKGLTLARTFYRAGHRVIGADFEDHHIPVSGHFSTSISTFYQLTRPGTESSPAMYMKDMIDIIKKEGVELWVSCSGVAFATKDGEAAEMIEKETKCKAIQFGLTLTATLHEKYSFIDNTRRLGLNVPETHLVTSETEFLAVLYPEKQRGPEGQLSPELQGQALERGPKYVLKSVFLDDSSRADMTLLPLSTLGDSELHIKRLNPTPFRPFVLQRYISGPEYCTHSLIVAGKVKVFVACPSAELLMHYTPLPTSSALSQAMLMYTILYAKKTGASMTGHFSIDFLVEEDVAREAERRVGVSEEEVRDLMGKIYPIECNPRAHTAVVCLADESENMAEAYLSVLPDHEPKGITNGHKSEAIVAPKAGTKGVYWVGHDVVTRVLLPVLRLWKREIGVTDVLQKWLEFAEHVIYWKDGTYEIWDPWPFWVLYIAYWPGMFLAALWERKWWSRCNVSTQKIFGC